MVKVPPSRKQWQKCLPKKGKDGEIDDGAGESDESEAMPFSTDPVTLPDENSEPETWFFVKTDAEGNPLPDQSEPHVSGGASSSNVANEEDNKKKKRGHGKKKKNKNKGGKKWVGCQV